MKTKTVIILVSVFLVWSTSFCQETGTRGAPFLKLGPGARAIGLGQAYTSLSDDATAIYWNPAGLGFTKRWELSFHYQKLFADFEYQAFFFTHQFRMLASRKTSLGIGVIRLGLTDGWDSTEGSMPAIGADDISDLAVIIPFAYRLDPVSEKLSVGLNYKYVKNKLAGYTSNSHGVDLGILFRTPVARNLFLSFGSTLQNLTLKKVKFIEEEKYLPMIFRAGTSMKFYLTDRQDFTLAYDLSLPRDNDLKHNLGLEYGLRLGVHRFGIRGGYRVLGEDLGNLAFSVGYGLDVTQMARNSVYSQIDYGLHNYDSDILGNTNLVSFSIEPNNPGPFKRLAPELNQHFLNKTEFLLTWEHATDEDDHDLVSYFVIVDRNYQKIAQIKSNAKEYIRNALREPNSLNLLYYELTSNNKTRFSYEEDSDEQEFYWAVIAYDRSINISVATGSDEIGRFTNKNLPDLEPVALSYTPVAKFDTSTYQGELFGKVQGIIKKPCKVAIYDSTDAKVVCTDRIERLMRGETFSFSGKWWTGNPVEHKLALVVDFENDIPERNETNNVMVKSFFTIPMGKVGTLDTLNLEELSYEHIELPIIPYLFFEKNSTEFSATTRTHNETDPDSILRLLGERLRNDYPGLRINLRGYTDIYSEKRMLGNERLALLRAQTVKRKLIDYGSRESQIAILSDHSDTEPRLEKTSSVIDPEEQKMISEENRRVEIKLPGNLPPTKMVEYEKRFFAPRVITRKKNEILSEKIKFELDLKSAILPKHLTIMIKDQKDDPFPIKIIEIDTFAQSNNWNLAIEWDGIKDNQRLIAFNKTYYFSCKLIDENGKVFEAPMQQFTITRDVIVKEKRIFALAKFNKVAPLHQFYIEQLDQVEDMMKLDDRIKVRFYGHTDMIGTEERNQVLSTERAMELAGWLAKIIDFDYSLTDSLKEQLKSRIDTPFSEDCPNYDQRFTFGKGAASPLVAKNIEYGSNTAPQGRTLDRRVDIEVYRMGGFEKPNLIIEKNITFHPWYHTTLPTNLGAKVDLQPKTRLATSPAGYTKPSEIASDLFAGAIGFDMPQDTTTVDSTAAEIAIDSTALESVPEKLDRPNLPVADVVEEEDASGIISALANRITSIERNGNLLWAGTENGLIKWQLGSDSYTLIELDLDKYQRITCLKYDPRANCLWVGTHKGLRRLSGERWGSDHNVGTGLSGNIINDITIDLSGNLLLGTNEGINIREGSSWRIMANVDRGLTDDYINDLYEDAEGNLWACTNNGACYRAPDGKWLAYEQNSSMPSDTVCCMTIDAEGNKWFGTLRGLCKFDRDANPKKFITYEESETITTDHIGALIAEPTKTLWCATGDGLSVYKDNVWYMYTYSDGLPETVVSSIITGPDQKIYAGTYGGGIAILRAVGTVEKPVVDKR
ncbi:PorV/PorQ family protein [candidate division KSB1 bacterium]|nr:PorV/PorQ family protein [candidate division KSB1 bacterium]